MLEEAKRLDYIDRAKGCLIILMIVGHIWQVSYAATLVYQFHMPAFFLISGYLLSLTKSYERGYGRFIKKRLFAFVLPYLFMDTIGILNDILRNGATLNWRGYLFNIISLRTNDIDVWFLRTLLVIELVFPPLLRILKKRGMVVLAVLCWVGSVLIDSENIYVEILDRILFHMLPFVIGFFWGKVFSVRKRLILLVCVLIVPLNAMISWRHIQTPYPIPYVLRLFSCFAGTYLTIQLSMLDLKPVSTLLQHYGKNSIIIYCTHHVLYTALGLLIGHADFSAITFLPGMVILLAILILEFPIIYCINRWLPFLVGRHYRDRAKFVWLPQKQKV